MSRRCFSFVCIKIWCLPFSLHCLRFFCAFLSTNSALVFVALFCFLFSAVLFWRCDVSFALLSLPHVHLGAGIAFSWRSAFCLRSFCFLLPLLHAKLTSCTVHVHRSTLGVFSCWFWFAAFLLLFLRCLPGFGGPKSPSCMVRVPTHQHPDHRYLLLCRVVAMHFECTAHPIHAHKGNLCRPKPHVRAPPCPHVSMHPCEVINTHHGMCDHP